MKAGWTEATLGEVASINPRLVGLPSDEELVSFVPMADLIATEARTTAGALRPFCDVSRGYTHFCRDDILVAKITPCFENGKIGRAAIGAAVGAGSTEFHVVRPDLKRLDPGYALRFMRRDDVRQQGVLRMTGSAGQRRVPASFLEALRIPLPPLAEQRRIVKVLDVADSLRRQRRAAMMLLDTLSGSIFDTVSNRTRPGEGSSARLGQHLLFVTSGARGWARYYAGCGTRFIRSLDVQENRISDDDAVFVVPPDTAEARRTRVMRGDVLLTITGSRIGRASAVPDKLEGAYVSQHVAILRPDQQKLASRFLAFSLSQSGGQRQIAQYQYGQTKPGLNFEQIRAFE